MDGRSVGDEVYLDDNGFVHITYHGDQDKRSGQRTIDRAMTIMKHLEKDDESIYILADIRDMGEHTPTARQVGLKARETMPYRKMAIIVSKSDPFTAKISRVMTSMSQRSKEIGYFSSEKQATEWLRRHGS